MKDLRYFKIHINGHHTFFINQNILCLFSGGLRKMMMNGKRISIIRIMNFPGGADGFELIARFCYNNGRIHMSPSNVCVLHCAASLLEMNEDAASGNLLSQTEAILDGLFYWTWGDILNSLRSCEPFFSTAESSGLLQKLVSCLLVKISSRSDNPLISSSPLQSSPSSTSSADNSGIHSSSIETLEAMKPCYGKEWWFEDLTALAPCIIERIMKALRSNGSPKTNLILTRFSLYYLKSAQLRRNGGDYTEIAEIAVNGLAITGRNLFSCRGLFRVLRLISELGLAKESKEKIEWLIGSMLDTAALDDLLVSGHGEGVYDVNLVMRLVRLFVNGEEVSLQRMKKTGRLMDKFLREISPDQSLKISKFLALAEILPDSARDCYDGVYRALDIYLESHPSTPFEERTRLCRCLNYEKLTLEACKDLAKNPRIPPFVTVQALVSQQDKLQIESTMANAIESESRSSAMDSLEGDSDLRSLEHSSDKESAALNLHKMQSRVIELEKYCKEMRGQMSKLLRGRRLTSNPKYQSSNVAPKFC